jgi:hypothetical protein
VFLRERKAGSPVKRRSRHFWRHRRNPAQITFADDLILIATGVVIGVVGYWAWSKNQEENESTTPAQPVQAGVDASGNPTSATLTPGGIGVFQNQTPAPLPAT